MSVKVSFVIDNGSERTCFSDFNQLDQSQKEFIRDRWISWEKRIMESAASHLLKGTLNQKTASNYKIMFMESKRSQSD